MKRDVGLVVVAAAALLVYANNLGGGFTYDDRFIIERNPLVQNLDWWGLLTSSYWGDIVAAGLYRPVTLVSFGLNRFLGASALGFHLVNNLLHAGASVLVVIATRSLGASRFVAIAAGLVFALHPLQTEAVDTIVGRAEILAFIFALAAFILFTRSDPAPRRTLWIGTLFFLALCSKESAAFAASWFVLYWLLFERRNLAPIAAALAAYVGLRVTMLGGFGIGGREIGFLDNPVAAAPFFTRLTSAPMLFAEYAKRLVWPVPLSADYSYNQLALTPDIRVALGLAVALALVWLAWTKRGLIGFAALSLAAPLAGFLHILFPLGTLFAERLTYSPMFGAVILAALALEALPRRQWILSILVIMSAAAVFDRNADWHDNETLFRRTVVTSPNSARAHFLLGAELLERGSYREAATSFETGLTIAPQHIGARMSAGEAWLEADEPEPALAAFDVAFERAPSDEIRARVVESALVAGRRSAREQAWERAHEYFGRAHELAPDNADAANSLGLVAERQGDVDQARRLYEEAIAELPDYTPALLNLASVHMSTGDLQQAEALFERVVSLAPASYEAYNGLGIALARQGSDEKAEAAFRKALEIDPSLETARDNLRALGKTP